jgi:glycosyltransferase involved in cell wall biosynthesis
MAAAGKPRVAVYADVAYSRRDGAVYADETFALFAAALRDNAPVVVLLGRLDPASPRPCPHRVRGDVELVSLPDYASLAAPAGVVLALARSVRRFWGTVGEVDAVWLLGPHPLAVAFAAIAAVRRRRVVLGVRQDLPAYMRHRHPGRRRLILAGDALEAVWRCLALAFPTVVVGGELARRYRRARALLPVTVSIVPAAAVRAPPPRPATGDLRVLSVGRLDREKNPLLLADVLARLSAADERWRLTVCGSGPLEGELAERLQRLGVAERAELRGTLPLDALRAEYEASDVLLHVSGTEGVPQVLLEAFAAGLPVVATDVGGVADATAGAALVVRPGDAHAAAAAIERLAGDPEERARLVGAGLQRARHHTIEAETARVAGLLAGEPAAAGRLAPPPPSRAGSLVAHRHTWVWTVLPVGCRRVRAVGDPALDTILDEAGFQLNGAGASPQAVLIARGGGSGRARLRAAARELVPGGLAAIAVGGGSRSVLERVPRPVRVLQLLLSPLAATAAGTEAARAARTLRREGLQVTALRTGDRARRHGLGRGSWARRRQLPVGWIVAGTRGPREPSVLDAAIAGASACAGTRLQRVAATVFESGKLLVELADPGGRAYVLRIAGKPARAQLDRSLDALARLARAGPEDSVRGRIPWPVAAGELGLARWSLEVKAPGRHPRWMTSGLWDECVEFLLSLHGLDAPRRSGDAGAELAVAAQRVAPHAVPGRRATLERLLPQLGERLDGMPLGWSHGDFWNENLLVSGDRLVAVLDWDWGDPHGLPALDLMDLLALSSRRTRGLEPGQRLLAVLWPLARAGGDARVRAYCAGTGTPADRGTLEGLAVAYWLLRVARDLRPFTDRARRPPWIAANVHAPLLALERAGW